MDSHRMSTYRDMFAVCAFALICLVTVNCSAPLDCKDTVKPLDQLDPRRLEGRWALVAATMKVIESPELFKPSDSISIDFYNSTFTKGNRYGSQCLYESQNISLSGHDFSYQVGEMFNFSGIFYQTSCSDCVVMSFTVESPIYKTEELLLFSKRREVDPKELNEFIAQVECLDMPEHYVMNSKEWLCPVRPHSSD